MENEPSTGQLCRDCSIKIIGKSQGPGNPYNCCLCSAVRSQLVERSRRGPFLIDVSTRLSIIRLKPGLTKLFYEIDLNSAGRFYLCEMLLCRSDCEEIYGSKALWMASPCVDFSNRVRQLLSWSQKCREEHPACVRPVLDLPTRLIEIRSDATGAFSPRLVTTLDGVPKRYTALSHCWGQPPETIFSWFRSEVETELQDLVHGPLKTTKETMMNHMQEIPWESLPKTFKDAMVVTRAMGLRYIWIDSLCIVQNDTADWQRESAMMATIFQGSELTIAATDSPNSEGGLFLESAKPPTTIESYDDSSRCMIRYEAAHINSFRGSPLCSRGWVLQELVMPKQRVHFTSDQMYWHCETLFASEDGSIEEESPDILPYETRSPGRRYFDTWQRLVHDYSCRKLTHRTDRLAALAGLATWYQGRSGKQPILGLWKESMASDLMWYTWAEGGSPRKSAFTGLPSWTWLYWDSCQVSFWNPLDSIPEFDLKVLDWTVDWDGQPLSSGVRTATLTVTGFLKQLTFGFDRKRKEVRVSTERKERSRQEWAELIVKRHKGKFLVYLDQFAHQQSFRRKESPRLQNADCLLLRRGMRDDDESTGIEIFLILQRYPSDSGACKYRRIGIGQATTTEEEHAWLFADAEKREVLLI